MKHAKPLTLGTIAVTGALAAGSALATAMPAASGLLPPAQHAGPVAYVSGGTDPAQAAAMLREAAGYPLELDFLWGRGAKETQISGVEWSIRNAAGHALVTASADGPVVLASLPDGRYTVTARYDGQVLSRVVDVHRRMHDTVVLEWPQ